MSLKCELLYQHRHTKARVLRLTTAHGEVITPVFMPVGTRAGVNNMMPNELRQAGATCILGGNTYHMLCSPGMASIEAAGGMHRFMGWNGPMLTDSGGFQIFSLAEAGGMFRVDESGAYFQVPETGTWMQMTPESSLAAQKSIGADFIMAFDQCTHDAASHEEAHEVMSRTHRWLMRSLTYHEQHPTAYAGHAQALLGIIQGGIYHDLRRESAAFVTSLPLDGIAIGGESIGFDMSKTVEIIRWIYDLLPVEKPRYTMGVGMSPQDLLDVVAEGIDMFDCVAPTRNARHGALYCGKLIPDGHWLKFDSPFPNHRLQIKKTCFADDLSPIMADCACYTCQHYSRAALHHLFKQKAVSVTALASIHNVHVMIQVCQAMRLHIEDTA